MIIFITIPWFLPAYKAGGPIQSIANLVASYKNNVEYRIFCSNTDLNNEILENIVVNEWVTYNEYCKIFYCSGNFNYLKLNQQLKLIKPDVVYINGLFSLTYNICQF